MDLCVAAHLCMDSCVAVHLCVDLCVAVRCIFAKEPECGQIFGCGCVRVFDILIHGDCGKEIHAQRFD